MVLSGRIARQRPDIDALAVRQVAQDAPTRAPRAIPGEFQEWMRLRGRALTLARAAQRRARNQGRDIPTAGAARRRAKTHRARGLCLETIGSRRCPNPAPNATRCAAHSPARRDLQESGCVSAPLS